MDNKIIVTNDLNNTYNTIDFYDFNKYIYFLFNDSISDQYIIDLRNSSNNKHLRFIASHKVLMINYTKFNKKVFILPAIEIMYYQKFTIDKWFVSIQEKKTQTIIYTNKFNFKINNYKNPYKNHKGAYKDYTL